jgi:hypothetical protein
MPLTLLTAERERAGEIHISIHPGLVFSFFPHRNTHTHTHTHMCVCVCVCVCVSAFAGKRWDGDAGYVLRQSGFSASVRPCFKFLVTCKLFLNSSRIVAIITTCSPVNAHILFLSCYYSACRESMAWFFNRAVMQKTNFATMNGVTVSSTGSEPWFQS